MSVCDVVGVDVVFGIGVPLEAGDEGLSWSLGNQDNTGSGRGIFVSFS